MIRYYPLSKIKVNLITGGNHLFLNGKSYSGKYYETYDGKYFTGANPIVGDNKQLYKISDLVRSIGDLDPYQPPVDDLGGPTEQTLINAYSISKRVTNSPISYFPKPTDADYRKGFITRYFIKKINDNGYITEISPSEYANFKDGTVNYDVSFYLTGQLVWKIIGPPNSVRLSQYNIVLGVIDANKSQVEKLNTTFLGIYDYIGENYTQFARLTK